MIDAIGSVVMTDYTVKDTTVDRSDASGSKCYTKIDGILLPHSVQRQRDDLLKVKDLGLTTKNTVLNVQWSISGKRQLKITAKSVKWSTGTHPTGKIARTPCTVLTASKREDIWAALCATKPN
eukprot:gene23211-26277_t